MQIFTRLDDPELIALIRSGAVGVLPTDTVYGLVCVAGNQAAATRLYALKHRDDKPGTLIAADVQQLVALGLKRRYLTAVEGYWPNSISVIIPCGPELHYLDRGKGLATRVPADKPLNELLQAAGPLLTSSANDPGAPTATTVAEAQTYFGDAVDFYVDGGDMSGRPASTIIRVVDDAIEVIREGAVKIDESGRMIK